MRKKSFMSSLVAVPHMVWCALFIVAPLLFVIYYSFTNTEGSFTLDNLTRLSDYGDTFLLSVEMSIIATFFAFLVGYPFAYFMARQSETGRKICMILLMLPMWTNLLIRTYSMMAILDDGGFLNSVLAWIGLGPVHIVGTKGAVIFGMAYDFFPYMVLPIYTAISKIDNRLMEAAQDLGCNGRRVLTRVVLPLSKSGIISGITMVFVPSISTFYISQKLGGGTFELIGDTIERQFQVPSTYNIGAMISLVMMILILISVAVMNRFSESED
ncbi:MAG: ABC transporter permease [Clostridia bacterium]|nr:ABC transporter permease [Clostridia bacterium]